MEHGFISAAEAKRRTGRNAQQNKEQLELEDSNWIKLEMAMATANGIYEVEYKFQHPNNWEKVWKDLSDQGYQLELVEENGKPKSIIIRWS
jgi:hypothetical protein